MGINGYIRGLKLICKQVYLWQFRSLMEKKRLDFHYINFSEELVLEIERGEKKEMYKG